VDLSLVAYEFGRRAAAGPLLPTNLVAAALAADDGTSHDDVLTGLLAGTTIATWCYSEPPPHDHIGDIRTEIRIDGDELVVDGVKRPAESAGEAAHLLVTGRTDDGLTQVLVPADAAGVSIEPMRTVDLTRRFSVVRFDGVRVPAGAAVGPVGRSDEQVDDQVQRALVVTAAEAVGAMQSAFDMTVEWAFDRYSFGRPLASYQALKHRFADMKTWLEAGHAISDEAAAAVGSGASDALDIASAALAFVGQQGGELMQECVQIHGGIGVTYEHDLHLFLRRHTVDRMLLGAPAEHRRRAADLLIAQEAS
jgi:alkylation response protein AidB-like acyl-CoA dehydrogenase